MEFYCYIQKVFVASIGNDTMYARANNIIRARK
jgi:hypothetical protein